MNDNPLMPPISAGLLLYRRREARLQVLLVHPGGPFHSGRDAGVWSIPKGLVEPGEDELAAARREVEEETGVRSEGRFLPLPEVRYASGKRVHAWAVEGDCDPDAVVSNTFEIEWPPRSGRIASFPEIDRAAFLELDDARRAILPAQRPLLDALALLVGGEDERHTAGRDEEAAG
jgi:predicted NUDIX family NTP pyrophosphohydrolase